MKHLFDYEERDEYRRVLKSKLNCDLIFFHPARQSWWLKSATMNRKGNDKLFRAFAKFVKSTRKKAKLIAIDRGYDLERSKKLVKDIGLEPYIIWMKLMKKLEIPHYYNVADIVFDQFDSGIFDMIAVEAMACGTPVFSYVKPAPPPPYPEMPPIVNVRSEEEIFQGLCKLVEDEDVRGNLGKKSREWI
jgi:glycosyltransferase involved in cell wall biosynthesis